MPQKILMCAPDFFGVDYVINPWMEGHRGDTSKPLVQQQWGKLQQALSEQVDVAYMPPQPGLPDLVFTANAGIVLGNKAIVSRFRSKERQGEEPFFHAWFQQNGFDILPWPQDVFFEGAGDALFDRGQKILWAGYGFRSDAAAPALLEKYLQFPTKGLHLVDPRFYHLDTCLCPLEGGYLMYFPAAFDAETQQIIAAHVPPEKRIVVAEEDAITFSCNAVDLNRHVFMNNASQDLQNKLRNAGFTPVIVPLSEFMKAGGAAKCLTLKLQE